MISARGMRRAASSAKRIIRTAPRAKFGAWKQASSRSRASASIFSSSKLVVPITHGTPRSSAAATFASTASGVVKSIIASAESRSTSSWPACSRAGARTWPTLPPRPKRVTFIYRPRRWRSRSPGQDARVDPPCRTPKDALVGADAGDRQLLGREQKPGELCDLIRLDRLELGDDPVEGEQLGVGDERLPEPAHPVRRRLHREHDPPLEVLLRAGDLFGSQVAGRDVRQLLGRDVQTGAEILGPRTDIDPDQSGVGVLRSERVDGVGHAALLADLLKESRRCGAAEDRVEDRGGEAAAVGARDSGCTQADVVLLRLLLGEAKAGWRRFDERAPDARPSRRGPLLALRLLQHTEELVVLDVAGGSDDDVSAGVHLPVIRRKDALR